MKYNQRQEIINTLNGSMNFTEKTRNNLISAVIDLIKEHDRKVYAAKSERLSQLETIIKDVIQYGKLYHHQKKQLQKLGFQINEELEMK